MKRNTFLKSLGLLAAGIVSGNKIFGAAKKTGSIELNPRKINGLSSGRLVNQIQIFKREEPFGWMLEDEVELFSEADRRYREKIEERIWYGGKIDDQLSTK